MFVHAGSIPVGAVPFRVASGNLDGVGRADLIVTASGDSVRPFYALADGGYLPGTVSNFGGQPEAMAVVDLDRDGRDEVVVGPRNAGNIGVLRSLGSLGFAPAASMSLSSPSPSSVRAIVAGDFNRDGKADLVAVAYPWTMRTLLGTGMGSFIWGGFFGGIYTPSSAAAGDVSGDGDLDLVVSGFLYDSLLFGNGDGGFVPAAGLAVLRADTDVSLADFSGDGRLDLVSIRNDSVLVSTNADGGFPLPAQGYAAGVNPHFLAVADFDANGELDVATCNSGNEISVLQGAVPLPFGLGARRSFPIRPFSGEAVAQHLTAADLDGDGVKDLAVANPYHSTVELLLSRCQ